MSQPPTPYTRQYNFAGWSVNNPTTPHQGNKLDQEYNALMASVNQTIARLGEIQKDDGTLRINEATALALAAESEGVLAAAAVASVAAAASGSHTHTIAQVTSLQAALDAKASNTALTSGLAGKANTAHTHVIADVTGLQASLDLKATEAALISGLANKANSSHTHAQSDVTGLTAALAAKVETTSTQIAKAWVNFNGTGTVAIRASFNVSSITDNGTGLYTINFTNALTDANYSAVFGASQDGATIGGLLCLNDSAGAPSTTSVRVKAINLGSSSASIGDRSYAYVGILR